MSLIPTKHDPVLMGFRGQPAKHAEQNLQTTHRQPSFSSPRGARETRATTVAGPVVVRMFPASRPWPRTPVASSSSNQAAASSSSSASTSEAAAAIPSFRQGPFATAPLAIHNHKAIFGWAANLFLAAATSQTTTAEKSGAGRLGDPVPGRGDVEGHR